MFLRHDKHSHLVGQDTATPYRRRVPTQQRSIERVEAILAAADELLVERGSDALKMSDIATHAGVAIGSVYQYFPDKPAILRELAVRFMDQVRAALAEGLGGMASKADALTRIDRLLVGYYEMFLEQPDSRDLWAATQADKELQQLDVQDSRANGALFFVHLAPFAPARHHERLRAVTFLYAHLTGAAVRLAIAVGRDEGDAMIDEMRAALARSLDELLVTE